MAELKAQRELFARAVAIGKTYSAAARDAGYSARSARSAGSSLMRVPSVRERVEELRHFVSVPPVDQIGETITIRIPLSLLRAAQIG